MKTKILENIVSKAYKKLKSSVYYDKTNLALRDNIVRFEWSKAEIDGVPLKKYLDKEVYSALFDDKKFDNLTARIFKSITVSALPKKVGPDVESKDVLNNTKNNLISNFSSNVVDVNQLQYFINMQVEGHILGVLWVMLVGYYIDQNIYEHSYGNRIRKTLKNDLSGNPTYSPYLFEPYFEQYESWRDTAMLEAKNHMRNKQDVIIITLDFARYYYSLDIDEQLMGTLYEEFETRFELDKHAKNFDSDQKKSEYLKVCRRLNGFVTKAIELYSLKMGKSFERRKILPIGFLPSNVIGNWCLKRFDNEIVNAWNPLYYGRYVDDILIVDKVERNSELFKKAKEGTLKSNEVIETFLVNCTRWTAGREVCSNRSKAYSLLMHVEDNKSEESEAVYQINPLYNPVSGNNSKITVKNDKVKVFLFNHEESDALITCFLNEISRNKSEFRHLPEDEAVFQNDDYSDIYLLSNKDTVNKFRGIESVSLDKFELSKFLGKYLRISGLVHDKAESEFEKDILKIFNKPAIVDNYTAWEKMIEIFVINERFDALERLCKRISDAILSISLTEKGCPSTVKDVQNSLYAHFFACLNRSFALVWKKARNESLERIVKSIPLLVSKQDEINNLALWYCKSRMVDKSVMPILFDMLEDDIVSFDKNVNLTIFNEVINHIKKEGDFSYIFYPYLIDVYDFSIISCIETISKEIDKNNKCRANEVMACFDQKVIFEELNKRYLESNYRCCPKENSNNIEIKADYFGKDGDKFCVSVGNGKKGKLKVAVANASVSHTSIEQTAKGSLDRSYKRYQGLTWIINSAIDEKADMLVMPEAFIPFEWLPIVARSCARDKLAVVTGVEHVRYQDMMLNLTAVILPFEDQEHKCAVICFHLKNHYAPSEAEVIKGYRLAPVKGRGYEVYRWQDCYFTVFCCYELSSIHDRASFQSYADMVIAVECNRDVKYYSNIIESLSRDIHCYCIQVNSSDYGDSRITRPTKSEEKDLIKIKGGINNSILIDEVNIEALRKFQVKESTLQKEDRMFKYTPPNLDKDIVMRKLKGETLF